MSAENLDLITGWASLILTLCIFSYLLGDNYFYRVAVHVLVGGTAGYVVVMAAESVIGPWLRLTVFAEGGDTDVAVRALGIIPFVLGLTLLLKLSPRVSRVGNVGLAFVVGTGTAVALAGAVAGTILPLTRDTGDSFENLPFLNALIMVLGTIGTMIYFQYLAKRFPDGHVSRTFPIRIMATIGKITIAVTLGAIYGGLILTSLTVLSAVINNQLTFLLNQIG